jgi:hypothetical protein
VKARSPPGFRSPWPTRRTRRPTAGSPPLSSQLVMAPSKVLDEAMTANDHPGGTVLLEAAHGTQPRLQAAVVGLDPVVGVLLGSMPRCREQLLQHDRVGGCSVRDHLDGQHLGRADGPLKEPTGCLGVAPWGDQHVDDLPELVDRTVDIAPLPGNLSYVSSTDQRSPTACRQGRAASASSGVNRSTHRYTVTWSTSTPRSVSSSSTSRYDSPKRRYQRTASTITSGGKRKPAKEVCGTGPRGGRRVLMATVWLRDAVAADATVPDHDPGSGQLRRQPDRPPRGPLTEGAITRTMHLVAANRWDSLRRGDHQRRVDDLGGAWSSPGWVMHR